MQRGLRADISPDQRHALERLEPIRWPDTTRSEDRPALPEPASMKTAPAPEAEVEHAEHDEDAE